ncbi:MAG: hypothetical protein IE931_10930 [Sphingobacteriales bacterium]|nr:hypothetical protein [Sphingobacteriales bacterium]
MGKIDKKEPNFSIPGKPMNQVELEKMIKIAEEGNFHSIKDLKAKVSDWKSKSEK